ncbi:hypothetical protein PAEAM_05320 [Paenibacillus sp. GM1FR]|nr:hypothetical protein PAEAM_05320 [Paenibacillus sp. GM1FR]
MGQTLENIIFDFKKKQLSEMVTFSDVTGNFFIVDHDGEYNCAGRYARIRSLKVSGKHSFQQMNKRTLKWVAWCQKVFI